MHSFDLRIFLFFKSIPIKFNFFMYSIKKQTNKKLINGPWHWHNFSWRRVFSSGCWMLFSGIRDMRVSPQNTKYKKEEKNREKNKMLENKILLARDEYRLVSFFFCFVFCNSNYSHKIFIFNFASKYLWYYFRTIYRDCIVWGPEVIGGDRTIIIITSIGTFSFN